MHRQTFIDDSLYVWDALCRFHDDLIVAFESIADISHLSLQHLRLS